MQSLFVLPLREQVALTTLLTQPHRHYHNINHVNDCLTELYQYYLNTENKNMSHIQAMILTYMIWYHDAIYNPYSPSGLNEEQSAILYSSEDYSPTIRHAIRATADHVRTQEDNPSSNPSFGEWPLTKIMLDIDLSGFGKPMHVYANNSMNIRREYYNTTNIDFVKGRLAFLQRINQRESFYYTDYFRDLYHSKSKENVALEIAALQHAATENDPNIYFERLFTYF